ncbi:uncharacterized protein [Henckelia pumila]|uniref:uncharacterized protein isoform X2 n=1 Tax=Henckelia pumila TaxID=405737 RepID=UPI003C6E44BA
MEKLFLQIFERKSRIIEQVKQQTEFFNQNLASKLLIEGITPPSWLWNPTGSSDPKELNKEELISKLLGPYTLDSVGCCTEQYPLYDKPFISGANQGSPTVSASRGDADAGCSHNCAPQLDFSITSPKAQITGGFLNISNAPDESLARIQRSKSRQKALELRNSANAVAESAIDHENIGDILSRRIRLSISSSKQTCNENKLTELEELYAFGSSCYDDLDLDEAACQNQDNGMDLYSGRITRSRSHVKTVSSGRNSSELGHSQNDRKDVSFHGANTCKRSSVCTSSREVADYHNRLLQSAGSSSAFAQNDGHIRLDSAGSLRKEKGDVYSGKISSFKSSHRPQSCASGPWKADSFSNDAQRMVGTKMDFGDDLRKDHVDGSGVRKDIFDVSHVDRDGRGSILEGGKSLQESSNISEPVHCSEIPSCLGTLSKSSPRKKSAVNDKVQNFPGCQTRQPWCETKDKDHIDGSQVKKNIFDVGCMDGDSRGSILEGVESYKESSNISEPVHCSEIPSCLGKLSRYSPRRKSAANDKVQNFSSCQTRQPWCETKDMCDEPGNVDSMMSNELVARNLINHSVSSSANGDAQIRVCLSSDCAKQRRQFESLVARDSIDSFDSEEIKQLDFNVIEEQNSKTFSSSFGKKRPDNSPKHISELDLLSNKEIPNHSCNPSLGGQSPEDSEVRDNVAEVHTISSECDILEHLDICTKKHVALVSENTTPKSPQDNIEVGNHQYSEVEGEADTLMSKMVDAPTLQFHPVKLCWEQGHEISAQQVIEEGNCSGERSAKSPEVSHATGSKNDRQSGFPKLADDPGEESHNFSSGQKEMANPMCVAIDEIEPFPAQEPQILSRLTGESQHADTLVEDNRSVTNYRSTKRGEDLLREGRFELVSIGSWPQLKRRKIEELQMNRLTSYPSSVKRVGSIQQDSPSRYLRDIEMDVNTDLPDSLDRKMSIDIEMDQDKDINYINTENLSHTTINLQAEKSPPLVDGQQPQCLVLSPKSKDLKFVAESMPEFERFNVETQADSGDLDFAADGVDLAELSLSRIAIERASIIEEMCRSASLDTPISHLSSALNFQGAVNPFQSLPNGLLEHLNLKTSLPLNVNANKQVDSGKSLVTDTGGALERIESVPYSVSLPYSGARYDWNSRVQHASPVRSLWERLSSHTGSSEKCSISNPELTCFPIEEDPCISEDNKWVDEIGDDVEEDTDSSLAHNCNVRHPLKDLANMDLNPSVSTFAQRDILRADTVDVMNAKSNVGGTQDDIRWSPKSQSRYYSEMRENKKSSLGNAKRKSYQTLSIGYGGTKKAKVSIDESVSKPTLSSKTSLKKQEQNVSLMNSKSNNIVSNICSFIPLVQQTQAAAAACAGKRDIKVKALEAAEAAKRLEEKQKNERKNRKEALKVERAKLEVENLRKMELEKKKKELERKKKNAEAIAKKRSREEEERKEKEKKRMRLEGKLRQREQEERGRVEKAEKEKRQTKDEQINSKKSYNEFKKEQNRGVVRGDSGASNKAVIEECRTSGDSFEAETALLTVDRSPKNEDLIVQKSREKSYEISPYQCSDDEDEEDEELPTKKYIPSWASKSSVALLLPLQRKMEPDLIFQPESFCSMDEVLLPHELQQRQKDA